MVAEPWLLKMGNQVSSNLKHALYLETLAKTSSKKNQCSEERHTLGILAFEVANVMSKVVHMYKSAADTEILKLKNEIFNSEGIKTLVSSDEKQLLELALVEKLDHLNRVANIVSRLGKRCTIPALVGFEHVYSDIVSGEIDINELGFLVKDMESMVRKMERYVKSTATLYAEMEVMNELDSATKKFQQNQLEETSKAFEQKLMWQKQDVKHLQDVSLWNLTYDKATELLARTVCTLYALIYTVFGDENLRGDSSNALFSWSQASLSGNPLHVKREYVAKSGQLGTVCNVKTDPSLRKSTSTKSKDSSGVVNKEDSEKRSISSRSKAGPQQKNDERLIRPEDYKFVCGNGPGRLFTECLNLRSPASKVDDDDDQDDDDRASYDDQSSQISGFSSVSGCAAKGHPYFSSSFIQAIERDRLNTDEIEPKGSLVNSSKFGPKSKLLAHAPSNTVGGSALSLRYANVIIVLEKLLRYPHLVGDEARDDLYQMLPMSLRKTLKTNLRSYAKDVAIYDAHLAHDWREKLDSMLKWIVPLAHNMIRWQSERSFEQRQIVTRTNVLLVQTLYFADREKTEAVMCELLVGLNYICRYEQQQNALLDCASSFDLEDCFEWQMQLRDSFCD